MNRNVLEIALLFAATIPAWSCAKHHLSTPRSGTPSDAQQQDPEPSPGLFNANAAFPEALADANLLNLETLTPRHRLLFEYGVNASLWSDGSLKRRYVYVPSESRITLNEARDGFVFPLGTVFLKQFMTATADGKLHGIETRLIAKKNDGEWYFTTYVWRDDGTVRKSSAAETIEVAGHSHRVPGKDECGLCHPGGKVLGFVPSQVVSAASLAPLDKMFAQGALGFSPSDLKDAVVLANPYDRKIALATRARTYLDLNCSSCHQPGGAAPSIDLRLSTKLEDTRLLQRRLLVLGKPKQSAVWLSMTTLETTERMPPVSLHPDAEAVGMVKEWIESLAQ